MNDLESSLRKDGVNGLNYINTKTIEYLSDDDVEVQLRLYVLLYADDTVILADSASDLQKALDSLYNYIQQSFKVRHSMLLLTSNWDAQSI